MSEDDVKAKDEGVRDGAWDKKPQGTQGADRSQAISEIGGPTGPEPTRYGDWERKGRCIDF
ncbi:MAG: DUF1674 domain-containing protein [Gammaproteobacteria bacterium]|nr:DUF1674 domain-containing protein [Gammaproteobacteria bacterium]